MVVGAVRLGMGEIVPSQHFALSVVVVAAVAVVLFLLPVVVVEVVVVMMCLLFCSRSWERFVDHNFPFFSKRA